MARGKAGGPDIKLSLSSASKQFRLAVDPRTGAKLWRVTEPDRERGSDPDATFRAKDWSLGAGLNRFTPVQDQGSVLRIADGYGIDTSGGQIKHGPGGASVGAIVGTMKKFIMFSNKVWILTSTHLYNYNGTTLVDFWGPAASGATHETQPGVLGMSDIALFNSKLYICDGSNIYRTDGTSDPIDADGGGVGGEDFSTDNADFLLSLDTALGPQLWRAYDTNLVASTIDPDTDSPAWSTDITVGPGEGINNIFDLSGLLFVTTESTIFSITSAGVAIQLDKSFQTQRSSTAFSVLSNTGSDAWLSDQSSDIFRMVAIDFEQFDIRPSGPFHSTGAIPFTELASRGNVKSIAQDVTNIYVVVERGSDVYVYKGSEISRGVFTWTPLIRRASTTNNAAGIFRLSGDSENFLYFNAGATVYKYQLKDWTLFNAEYQVEFPYFDNQDELEVDVFTRLLVFAERTGTAGTIVATPARKLDNASSFTNLPFTFDSNGISALTVGILTGLRIRLRITVTSSNTADRYDLRSIKFEGLRKPELRNLYDFTVLAKSKGDLTFLNSLRTTTTAYPLFEDRFGNSKQGVVLFGYPEESEGPDENVHGPQRRYRMIIQEVLS